MAKILGNPWLMMLLGVMTYVGTTAAVINLKWEALQPVVEVEEKPAPGPSWTFQNPEVDMLITELKAEKDALTSREIQLKELETRLKAEQQEINLVKQRVIQMQHDLDQSITRITLEEQSNLKKLAKTYVEMPPESSAKLLRQMEDRVVVKYLSIMKEAEVAGILDAFTKLGNEETKRAALISDQLRLLLNDGALAKKKRP